jgi:hypothetical protein
VITDDEHLRRLTLRQLVTWGMRTELDGWPRVDTYDVYTLRSPATAVAMTMAAVTCGSHFRAKPSDVRSMHSFFGASELDVYVYPPSDMHDLMSDGLGYLNFLIVDSVNVYVGTFGCTHPKTDDEIIANRTIRTCTTCNQTRMEALCQTTPNP